MRSYFQTIEAWAGFCLSRVSIQYSTGTIDASPVPCVCFWKRKDGGGRREE